MDWKTEFDRRMSVFPGVKVLPDEPMKRHTSFRTGGAASRMAFPKNAGEFILVLSSVPDDAPEPFVMGSGTNLLAPDTGLDRLIINTRDMRKLEPGPDPYTIFAAAGCSLRQAAEFACTRGLTGLEFAHGIPGTVGGGVCMNAGAYDGEMSQVLSGALVLSDMDISYLSVDALELSYRHSIVMEQSRTYVLQALFRLRPGSPADIRAKMEHLLSRRKASQPLEFPSAGSTFKRPPGHYAGTLIEQCGLKGLRVGGAEVSTKHAGFVINRGDATSADILAVIREVQKRVFDKTGVTLEPEVRILE
ncbi:MAG: UDP-N-acetylmuramate dehydrogenase [Oscillospiraceae bacterium]|nr:UDP-N-acetylmuramate dehydrogenase [Oscillospiraceae bacterium]